MGTYVGRIADVNADSKKYLICTDDNQLVWCSMTAPNGTVEFDVPVPNPTQQDVNGTSSTMPPKAKSVASHFTV